MPNNNKKDVLLEYKAFTKDAFETDEPLEQIVEEDAEVEKFLRRVLGPELYPWSGRGKRTSHYYDEEEAEDE